jgi:hypothetical protein
VTHPTVTNSRSSSSVRSTRALFAQLSSRVGSSEKGGCGREHGADERRSACRSQTLADHVTDDQCGGVVRPFRNEVEVAAHSLGCRNERGVDVNARPTGQLGRCQGIADRPQVVELELVRGQPLELPVNNLLANSRFASQPLDESAQSTLAAAMLVRLDSEPSNLIGRLRRLVAKPRDLAHLVTRFSPKPSELPVGRGPVLRHTLKPMKPPPHWLRNGARAAPTRLARHLLSPTRAIPGS